MERKSCNQVGDGFPCHKGRLILLLSFVMLFYGATPSSRAETASDLIKQIKKEKAALQKIEANIQKNKKGNIAAKRKERSILAAIETTDRRFSLLRKEVALLEIEIRKKEREEKGLSIDIKEARVEIEETRDLIARRLRRLYKEKRGTSLKVLMASQDYPELLRRLHYLKTLSKKEGEMLVRFKKGHAELVAKKDQLSQVKSQLIENRESLARKLMESRAERKKKGRLLARVRKEKRFYRKALSEMLKSSGQIQTMIKTLEGEKKRLKASLPGRFSRERGQLRWPNDGRIVSLFGKQKHPKFDTTVYRKGIEIAPVRRGEVRSVYGGAVVYADWFRGYGMMVIIDHGENYYSLYAHLAKLLVGIGDQVKTNRVIGTVGKTGLSQGAKLYFEIRHQGEPVNPLSWLKKRR